jgi:outer membrane protein OmpA-like peptidoglycan-associated protein
MEIDLVSHTDTRGDAPLNLELTEERAKNAKAYLEHLGIAPSRINAYGKGETEPRNRCTEGVECSDQEHMENSRIEIRIRKLGKTQRPQFFICGWLILSGLRGLGGSLFLT